MEYILFKHLGVSIIVASAFALMLIPSVAHAQCSNEYIVQSGDFLSRISPSDWQKIANENGIPNPNLIYVGQHICLSGNAPSVTNSYQQPQVYTGNHPNIGYPGSCVWYVFNQRPDIYLPPTAYAKDFAWVAASQGYATGNYPRVGAIAVFQAGVDGANPVAGHVGIVDAVYGNGTFAIREMAAVAGMWNVDTRIVSSGWGVSFIY